MTIKQQGGVFGRNPTFQDVSVDGALDLPDGVKASFGTSDDLQIFHSGTNSFIQELGTGGLYIQSAPTVLIGSSTQTNLIVSDGGAVTIRHNGLNKLATTAAGVSVTGNVAVTDGGGIDFSATSGTGTSELFDDYEEGYHVVTATPETSGTLTLDTAFDRDTFRYTKIGQRVFVSGCLQFLSVASPVGTWFSVSLPFAVANVGGLSDRSAGVALQENTGTTAAVTLDGGQSVAKVLLDPSTISTGSGGRIYINFDYVT